MTSKRQGTPLQSLTFFESAVRHLNFTLVAEELGTSQPAVSHRIASLEKDLGVALFKRAHRGVTLTPDGLHLFETVRDNLAAIQDALDKIRARRNRQVLTVATDFAFANFWLVPRLAAFQQLEPALDVRIVTSQHPFDIRGEQVDLAISFGDGQWPGCEAEHLLPEIVVPVCSPALLAKHKLDHLPGQVLRLPLLHLESAGKSRWMTWEDWAELQGLPRGDGAGESQRLTLGNYPLLIQAAIAGQGVALGWRPLVDALLANGQLARVPVAPVTTTRGYFLVRPQSKPSWPALDRLRDWIGQACRTDAQGMHV